MTGEILQHPTHFKCLFFCQTWGAISWNDRVPGLAFFCFLVWAIIESFLLVTSLPPPVPLSDVVLFSSLHPAHHGPIFTDIFLSYLCFQSTCLLARLEPMLPTFNLTMHIHVVLCFTHTLSWRTQIPSLLLSYILQHSLCLIKNHDRRYGSIDPMTSWVWRLHPSYELTWQTAKWG